jgi:hypothetical protein
MAARTAIIEAPTTAACIRLVICASMSQPTEEIEQPSPEGESGVDPVPPPSRRERLQAAAGRLKDRAVELLSGLQRIRPESRTVSAGFLIFERDREFPTSLLTGALAARLVIFVIPFLVLFIFTIGLGADLAITSAAEAAEDAGLTGMFAQAAEDSSLGSGQWRLAGLLFTAFAAVWAANGLGRTIRLATSVIWRAPRQRVQRRWLTPLVVIGYSLVVMVVNAAGRLANVPGAIDDVFRLAVELLIVAGMWIVASRFLPHDPEADQWREFAPGALLMGVALIAMRTAMTFYLIPKWNTLSDRYGDIGIVLVLLSFSYIVGFAMVASAHVNSAAFYTRRDPTKVAPDKRNWPLLDLLREERKTWSKDGTD